VKEQSCKQICILYGALHIYDHLSELENLLYGPPFAGYRIDDIAFSIPQCSVLVLTAIRAYTGLTDPLRGTICWAKLVDMFTLVS
jgi:hypothetical protein